tara:strand:- start:1174 stop:1761 length:588 start_codon:yes stop_codon:yes gene_type:complete
MRKSASEIIRELESRVARLENRSASTQRKAGPGAAVEVCLSGRSRNTRCIAPEIDTELRATMGRDGVPILHGNIFVQEVTIASYYNSKDIEDDVISIDAGEIDLDLDLDYDDGVEVESIELTGHCELDNSIVGSGYSRGSAPKHIDVSGELEVEITFDDGDYRVDMVPFQASAKTSKEFQLMWNTLDDVDEDEDY